MLMEQHTSECRDTRCDPDIDRVMALIADYAEDELHNVDLETGFDDLPRGGLDCPSRPASASSLRSAIHLMIRLVS